VQRVRKAYAVEQTVVQEIEQRPGQIRNQHGLEAALGKASEVKGGVDVQIVEQAKGGDKEEDGHAEPGKGFQECHQMNVGSRIHDVLRTDMDADNPHHGNAADVFDGGKSWLAGQSCCLHREKHLDKNNYLTIIAKNKAQCHQGFNRRFCSG